MCLPDGEAVQWCEVTKPDQVGMSLKLLSSKRLPIPAYGPVRSVPFANLEDVPSDGYNQILGLGDPFLHRHDLPSGLDLDPTIKPTGRPKLRQFQ